MTQLPPARLAVGVVAHEGSTVVVVLNSLRLLFVNVSVASPERAIFAGWNTGSPSETIARVPMARSRVSTSRTPS